MDSKKKRYQDELRRIKQLSAINKVLKKGDVENAFLNNTDKDSEITKDTAVEKMLEDLQSDKNESKDLALLDSLVSSGAVTRANLNPNKSTRKPSTSKRVAAKPKRAKVAKKIVKKKRK